MHGGATPRGTESPHFKHGLYSRYAAPALAARIAELRQEEDRLHDLREVMAVQGALLGEALQQGDLGAASALTEAISRSIDRYHKHNPPEESPVRFTRIERVIVGNDPAQLTVEQLDAKVQELLGIRYRRDPNTLVIVNHDGNPMQDTDTGNP